MGTDIAFYLNATLTSHSLFKHNKLKRKLMFGLQTTYTHTVFIPLFYPSKSSNCLDQMKSTLQFFGKDPSIDWHIHYVSMDGLPEIFTHMPSHAYELE